MLNVETVEQFRRVIDHSQKKKQGLTEGFMGRMKDVFQSEEPFDSDQWIQALWEKDKETIIQIIETTDVDINEPVTIEQTLLYPLTAVMSDPDIVELLLEYGADSNLGAEEFPEHRPAKPIIESVFDNFSHSVDVMLNHGADPNLRFTYTGNGTVKGFPLLSLASLKGGTQIMQSLITAGADPVAVDYDGRDALTYAVFGDSIGAIRVLKDTKAHLRRSRDRLGKTALDYAIELGRNDLANVIQRGSA